MKTRQELLAEYDPNGVGLVNAGLYGLPFGVEQARIVIIPMPWDVTVSYGHGTARGPEAILAASPQLDLHIPGIERAWELGLALDEADTETAARSRQLRSAAERIIQMLESGADATASHGALYAELNQACEDMSARLQRRAGELLDQGKVVGVLGGDHSTPLGLIRALAERHEQFGILQIDAHADLRDAYEGFAQSHASIMFNALKIPQIQRLTQVGVRDICAAEVELAASDERIRLFHDEEIQARRFEGESWRAQCERIAATLPDKVYISFDIDGLDPVLCPNTGTPVPGGLQFNEAIYLIEQVVRSGRTIIGFDLVEVNPAEGGDEWDANVGARILYRMACLCGVSHDMLRRTKADLSGQ